jgi:ribokinase
MTAILSLGSINADFELRVERPPEGPGTLLAHDLLRTSGGKAANAAVLARRLGAEARLLGASATTTSPSRRSPGRPGKASTSPSSVARPVLPASRASSSCPVATRRSCSR